MKQIILDTSVAAADALATTELQITISLNGDNVSISGKQAVPYNGGIKEFQLDGYYNQRIAEQQTMLDKMAAGADKTKLQARVDAGNAFITAIQAAATTYMQAIYALENGG